MWFLIKTFISMVAIGGCAYALFFIDVGGRTLAGHLSDVWASPTVQDKVALVKDGVRNELEEKLAAAAEETTRKAVRDQLGGSASRDDLDARDRDSLEATLRETGLP